MVPIPIVPIVGIQPLEVSVFVIRTPQIRTVPPQENPLTPHHILCRMCLSRNQKTLSTTQFKHLQKSRNFHHLSLSDVIV